MDVRITHTTDAAEAMNLAGDFLCTDPARNTVLLTILDGRIAWPDPGRYWVMHDGATDRVVGFAAQSPLDRPLIVSGMPDEAIAELVRTIHAAGTELPGVIGPAAPGARCAGLWVEHTVTGAAPKVGMRLFEAPSIHMPPGVRGRVRTAGADDRAQLIQWSTAFRQEAGTPAGNVETETDRRIADGCIRFLVDVDGDPAPVSMASHSRIVHGVARVQLVYTPPELRGRGYAGLCTAVLTQELLDRGLRVVLYTDLGNPVSNALYAKLGYRSVSEALEYTFEAPTRSP
ncbi:MAG: GNAT family N-acetyltransferase [Planctomycetota bacterium]